MLIGVSEFGMGRIGVLRHVAPCRTGIGRQKGSAAVVASAISRKKLAHLIAHYTVITFQALPYP
jgi:hypothetical protein